MVILDSFESVKGQRNDSTDIQCIAQSTFEGLERVSVSLKRKGKKRTMEVLYSTTQHGNI
jgi:hypothetical protein